MRGTRHLIILGLIIISLLLTGCIGKNNNRKLHEDITKNETSMKESSGETDKEKIYGDYPQVGVWSPDRKWVAVTNKVKSRNDTVLLEVSSNKKIEMGIFDYIKNNSKKFEYNINDDKVHEQDIDFMEWSPDSSKILLSFGFEDDISVWQTGLVVYNLDNMSVEWLLKLNDTKNGNSNVEKPECFNWDGKGYGLEEVLST